MDCCRHHIDLGIFRSLQPALRLDVAIRTGNCP
ncbi:hypothetical protein BSS2_I0765 [Brucella suis bv. 1 str. S2]|uniref:Uncharacterized protein n=1 Tax=Brucella suis biovar 1 (strain 1330) TaxID=204722 RepID=A0A0H3G2R4_BRUSU|nr:hypothetical protein BR0784 [Brucella suis 1330]AEM18130.1 hypothetical protein BS1330_I0780 [Brucella suis 1330]AEU05798.1 hypothetical protein BSVBI22_A0780 [Brucella suis VBI22]AHN46422.1 hypothetical protein BSS2_I0765 [Brucella suis bv. 1 str. S2]CDL76187.1 unnamed protein product [Brucella canis str. Oliveri]